MDFLGLVTKIKEKNSGKVVIVKSGIFYYALGDDALIMEKYCKLDKICFSANICKVGFPLNSLEKYMDMLKYNSISFCVYGFGYENNFIDENVFKYKDKEYGKIFEFQGENVDYSLVKKDCFNCKFYEREIIRNVSRLTYTVSKYLEEIEEFNQYQYNKENNYNFLDGNLNER